MNRHKPQNRFEKELEKRIETLDKNYCGFHYNEFLKLSDIYSTCSIEYISNIFLNELFYDMEDLDKTDRIYKKMEDSSEKYEELAMRSLVSSVTAKRKEDIPNAEHFLDQMMSMAFYELTNDMITRDEYELLKDTKKYMNEYLIVFREAYKLYLKQATDDFEERNIINDKDVKKFVNQYHQDEDSNEIINAMKTIPSRICHKGEIYSENKI